MTRLLLDLDSDRGTDPLGVYGRFVKRIADVLTSRFGVVFRRLLRLGSFYGTRWKLANVIPIPKCSLSCTMANFKPISITPVLS